MLVPHPISDSKKKKEVNDIPNPLNLFDIKLTEPRWPFID